MKPIINSDENKAMRTIVSIYIYQEGTSNTEKIITTNCDLLISVDYDEASVSVSFIFKLYSENFKKSLS